MMIRLAMLGLLMPFASSAQTSGPQTPLLASNHALIITVSQYQRSPLPGVLDDRKIANHLAIRFGVPPQNIVELSENEVTREGLKRVMASMGKSIMPGDKLYVYYSGHGARFFSKAANQCTESIVTQDMKFITNAEFASMLKPLSAKADKTVVMLDSCHSGGVAQASSRDLGAQRPKFLAEASSPQCALAVNDRSFSQIRGNELSTTDHNVVILAAARNNEVAWDTSRGGALTYNFEQCLDSAADTDHSGALSMQELTACVQARLDKTQDEAARQHVTLAGNGSLVPMLLDPGGGAPASTAADPGAALNDVYGQRDDRWEVEAKLSQPKLKIGSKLALSVRSSRDGFVYLFYQGTQPGSFYLLFPNQLDSNNAISANQAMQLPRAAWSVTALGPRGTDHLLVMVSAAARDFSTLALPAAYVSTAGPFKKFNATSQAMAHVTQVATLSAASSKNVCQQAGEQRDVGSLANCSNVFGASLTSVEETD